MDNKWKQLFKQKDAYELKTILNLLQKLNFKQTFKIIHVVGTNGKGSVASILHYNLIKNGFKVGLFTSPHLQKPHERIKVNDEIIGDQKFWSIFHSLPLKINFFATFYIVAMIYFMQENCQIVILEAGIGGRLDATNTIKGDYGLITSINYDHMDLLGNSLIKIAREKYAIKNLKMRFYVPLTINHHVINLFNQPNTFLIANFADNYQTQNFILAKVFLNIEFNLSIVENIKIRGRNDCFPHNKHLTIFDVGHNESGILATLELLKQKKLTVQNIVIAMKKTKKINKLPQILEHYNVHYYQKNNYFHNFKINNWQRINNLQEFFKKQNCPTLYIGSFQLIGDLYDFKT